jgi:hypothetical protein
MPNTNALNRVKANNAVAQPVGIRLSTSQLIKLANLLDNIENGPDGVTFEVGLEKGNRTIEIIPYVIKPNGVREYYSKNGLVGKINVNLGKETTNSNFKLVVNDNGVLADPPFGAMPAGAAPVAAIATGNSQRTPPPFAP